MPLSRERGVVSSAVERFTDTARLRGVEVVTHHFPEGTRTAADAAAAVGCDVAQIVKSLVFIADDAPTLVLTSGRHRVDEGKLAAALGATTVRRASAGEVRAATGYAIGGAPPFGHPAPLRTVIDPLLLTFPVVWSAAGTPHDVFPLEPERLAALTGGDVADVVASS